MTTKKDNRYFEAVGRRKTAVARVRLTPSTKTSYVVNGRGLEEYFPTKALQNAVESALSAIEGNNFTISAKVVGGGIAGQADAVKLGIARAAILVDGELRSPLKKEGLLTRDPRAKERRKFGLKKARKSPQWSKR